MGDIFDNSSLKPTTPVSGQEAQGATQTTGQAETPGTQTTEQNPSAGTQTTEQNPSAAVQTTDADQAAGGQDNAGVQPQEQVVTGLPQFQLQYNEPGADGRPAAPTMIVAPGQTPPAATPADIPAPPSNDDGQTATVEAKSGQFTMNHNVAGQHLADWANSSFVDVVKNGDKSIADYMRDYNKWARENNQEPLDVFDMMQAINGNDISESYAANEKAKKKLERQQKWEQIGNVLAHLGNFVGTIAGAPSATYETGEHLTARQKAVRDAMQKQNGDPKNILAMIWKDRADQRARELNNANIALQTARKTNVEGQTANQKAQSDANVALRGAQQRQADTQADENEAQTDYVQAQTDYVEDKNKREQELQPLKKKNIQSSTNANNARANASNASAAHSRAETHATNVRAYGASYTANRYRIWSKNRRLHPNESREFMKANNIHGFDKKNWTPTLIDQFNGFIADKFSNRGKGGTKASSLLD